jgi:hypothetical protein
MLIGHRTTARSFLTALVIAGSLAGPAGAAVPDPIVFPVVGPTSYTNDFGAPRGSRSHQGNDIMAARRTPVVAAERGRVRIYRGSSRAGCMLYLYGVSGTTYMYVHLNDDLTMKDDNRATNCRLGVAYAAGLRDNQMVGVGRLIGFVGNSGDARGIAPHLHFEIHPNGGRAVSPYKWLRNAQQQLWTTRTEVKEARVGIHGILKAVGEQALRVGVYRIGVNPGPRTYWRGRDVRIAYGSETVVERRSADGKVTTSSVAKAQPGERISLWTPLVVPTLANRLAAPRVLAAERVLLLGKPT